MFTEEEWKKVIRGSYTERMVDFTEPLPPEDQAYLDSIAQEARK